MSKENAIEEILELREFVGYFTNQLGPRNVDKVNERLDKIMAFVETKCI